MILKNSLSAFRSKHFQNRETNDVNTVSIFNFVALKSDDFFLIFENLYTVVASFD